MFGSRNEGKFRMAHTKEKICFLLKEANFAGRAKESAEGAESHLLWLHPGHNFLKIFLRQIKPNKYSFHLSKNAKKIIYLPLHWSLYTS